MPTLLVDQGHDFFIDQTAQDHLDYIHGLSVGDTVTIDKFAFLANALEHLTNLRTAAMNHYRVHAYQFHQYHITRKTLLELFIFHGMTAVLNHQCLPLEALDIGQRLSQHLSNIHGIVNCKCHGLVSVAKLTLACRQQKVAHCRDTAPVNAMTA